MEEIIMVVLYGVFVVGGSLAALIAFCVYCFLAWRGDSPTLLSTGEGGNAGFWGHVFLAFAAIGFLACLFQGAQSLLFWIPADWGQVGSDGDFTSVRASIAAIVCSAALFLLAALARAPRDRAKLDVLREHLERERKLFGLHNLKDLDAFQSQIETERDELKKAAPERPLEGAGKLYREYIELDSYRELLVQANKHREALRLRLRSEARRAGLNRVSTE